MKVNVRGRRSGCTSDLIITADITGSIIVCPNKMWANNIEKMAHEMERDVRVVTYDECEKFNVCKNDTPLLFDGFESMIENIVRKKYGNVIGCMIQDKSITPHIKGRKYEDI